jgi:ribosomal protein L33
MAMNPQNSDQNPYDFIMNPNAPAPKKPLGLGGKNAFLVKIGLIAGGAVVLMIVIAIVVNSLTGSKTNTADLEALAATQTEIVRVAAQGTGGSSSATNVKSLAISTQLTILTQQETTINYLSTKNIKLNSKKLSANKNAETDTKLQAASNSSTFDTVFVGVMKDQLASYLSDLETYYKNSQNSDIKAILKTDFQQTQLLQQQIPSTTTITSS